MHCLSATAVALAPDSRLHFVLDTARVVRRSYVLCPGRVNIGNLIPIQLSAIASHNK